MRWDGVRIDVTEGDNPVTRLDSGSIFTTGGTGVFGAPIGVDIDESGIRVGAGALSVFLGSSTSMGGGQSFVKIG